MYWSPPLRRSGALKNGLKWKENGSEDGLFKVNLEELYERRENLCLKFAKKSLKNDKTKDLFKVNDKTHIMKNRNTEKYDVNYANTGRFKKSE